MLTKTAFFIYLFIKKNTVNTEKQIAVLDLDIFKM